MSYRKSFQPVVVLCLLLCVHGCTTTPQREISEVDIAIPDKWFAQVEAGESTKAMQSSWVQSFDDPVLHKLIDQALTGNFDLKAVAARVEAAMAQARIDGADLWPQLAFAPGYQYTQVRNAGFGSARFSVFETLFNLSWEVDLWGRIRSLQEATLQEVTAADADFQAVRLSLIARVAQYYFILLEAKLQTRVAEQSVTDRSTIASLVQGRFERGLVRALDVRLVLTDLAQARSRLAQAKNQVQLITRQLEIPLGDYPDGSLSDIDTAVTALSDSTVRQMLPVLPPRLPAGLPSELLSRRPDLQASFARLRAADARLDSANKLLLPRITLTAVGGTRDRALTNLIDPNSVVWSLFAGAFQPLFTGGRIRGGIAFAQARATEALHRYQETVLNAFREVEQTLAAEEWLRTQEIQLRAAVQQTETSQQLALYAYRQGFIQILTLLDSYRSTFNAQSAHLVVQRQLLNNRITLYLALGGGY